jgi:ArsR family transcriptional regulator, arsenate/arsenite/antimonite-responsive transcriptional repressor
MMREVLAITNALADESRVRILMALMGGQLCVCQIAELLQLAPSTVSKHLYILRQGRLVESQKSGRWINYSLPKERDPSAHQPIEWLQAALKKDSKILEDAKRLKMILKMDPEEICRRQLGKSKSSSSAPEIPAAVRWLKAGRASSRAR